MAQLVSEHDLNQICDDFIGPLLDDAAPYSGLGIEELKILQGIFITLMEFEVPSYARLFGSRYNLAIFGGRTL